MKLISVLALAMLATVVSGLHLHYQVLPIHADNLDSSNQCYYFGNSDQIAYFSAQSSFRQQHPEVQSCPPSIPYVNINDANHSCFSCDQLKQGIDISKAKVLFNVGTRQCEVCSSGKNSVCDKLIAGTYFTLTTTTTTTTTTTPSTSQPAAQPASSSSQTTSNTSTTGASSSPTQSKAATTSQQTTKTTAQPASIQATPSTTQASTPSTVQTSVTATEGNCPPQRPLYRSDTKLCDSCPAGTQFIGTKQECIPMIYVTDPASKDLILSNLTELIDLNKRVQKEHPEQVVQFCPAAAPYSQLNKCIKCSQTNQYFYVTTQACVTGCPEGTYYDERVMQCAPALFYSDVNAHGIVSQLGNYDKWKAEVDYQASSSPRMTKCPSIKPFEQKDKCISCDGSYFDIDQKICVTCSRGRYYDAGKRSCVGAISWDHSMKTFASAVI